MDLGSPDERSSSSEPVEYLLCSPLQVHVLIWGHSSNLASPLVSLTGSLSPQTY